MAPEEAAGVAAGSPSPITHQASPRFKALPPLSLYIHIPWCARKCPYCDFNSHEVRGAVPEARYIAALVADLEQALPLVWGRRVISVFLGGGTPSLFSPQGIDAILAAVRARLALAPDAEVTLEANPGTVDAERFRGFRAAGVNRLSVGVQSFDARYLKALRRVHDEREARRAVESAMHYFDNVNLDLMYGLPGQSVDDAAADIEAAVSLAPPHLSVYHLTIEPNTYFHRFPPALPDEDAAAAMQDAIEARLADAGYEHYEVSAYALRRAAHDRATKPEGARSSFVAGGSARCRHNMNYWTFGDYLGIGAGAHGKLSFPERIVRQARAKHPEGYMSAVAKGAAFVQEREVVAKDVGSEFMMNALRLTDGFAVRLFEERAGIPLTAVQRALDEAERRRLIVRDHVRIAPTPVGRRFLNDLLQIFLGEADDSRKPR